MGQNHCWLCPIRSVDSSKESERMGAKKPVISSSPVFRAELLLSATGNATAINPND